MKIKDPRRRRYLRGKKKALGTKDRPRLFLYRSLKNMTAQLIDDVSGKTLMSVITRGKNTGNVAASSALGEVFAKKAIKANIKRVRFDRSGYLFHGRVKAFAEACLKNGLQF